MSYVRVGVTVTKRQLGLLKNAIENGTGCTLVLTHPQLVEPLDVILVTSAQRAKIAAAAAAGEPVTVKLSAKCVQEMHTQIGTGILDSLGSFFNSARSVVSNAANSVRNAGASAWRGVQSAARNVTRAPPPRATVVAKPGAVPAFTDYGSVHDNKPPSWKPPQKSTFDTIAEKVGNFDQGINKMFGYPSSANTKKWKQEVAHFPDHPEDF